jgi:hypothetical protein
MTRFSKLLRSRRAAISITLCALVGGTLVQCTPSTSLTLVFQTQTQSSAASGDRFDAHVRLVNTSTSQSPSDLVAHAWLALSSQRSSSDAAAGMPQPIGQVAPSSDLQLDIPIIVNRAIATGADTSLYICISGASLSNEICTSNAPLHITGPTAGGQDLGGSTTSAALIQSGVNAGDLTPEQGLLYRTYALIHDPRLPLQYQASGTTDVLQLVDDIDNAPATSQSALAALWQPSFSDVGNRATGPRAQSRSKGLLDCTPNLTKWDYEPKTGPEGHFKVWFLRSLPDEDPSAAALASYANDKIWPLFTTLLGRTPIPDTGITCNGGDSRYDILLEDTQSYTVPYWPFGVGGKPLSCSGVAAYSVISDYSIRNYKLSGLTYTESAMAHEIFHAYDLAFTKSGLGTCSAEHWYAEGAANWGERQVDPNDIANSVGSPVCLYDTSKSLNTDEADSGSRTLPPHQYATWAFDEWATRRVNSHFVREVYNAMSNNNVMSSINSALGGDASHTVIDRYINFGNQFWNLAPPFNDFNSWYGSPCTAPPGIQQYDISSPYVSASIPVDLKHLSSRFFRLNLGQNTVFRRHDMLGSGLDELAITYMLRFGSGTYNYAGFTLGSGTTMFCLPVGKVIEPSLLVVNTSPSNDVPSGRTVPFESSNLGCGPWVGAVSGSADWLLNDGRRAHWIWNLQVSLGPKSTAPNGLVDFGYGGFHSSISGSYLVQGYSPNPVPGCPNTVQAGPFSYSGEVGDGLRASLFSRDAAPYTRGVYFASTASPSFGGFDRCWESSSGGPAVPWLWTESAPGNFQISSDGQEMKGSSTDSQAFPKSSLSASWTWDLHSQTPAAPANFDGRNGYRLATGVGIRQQTCGPGRGASLVCGNPAFPARK